LQPRRAAFDADTGGTSLTHRTRRETPAAVVHRRRSVDTRPATNRRVAGTTYPGDARAAAGRVTRPTVVGAGHEVDTLTGAAREPLATSRTLTPVAGLT